MSKYSYYDAKERVIFSDLSGLTLTRQVLDEFATELYQIIHSLPTKVFMVARWKDTRIGEGMADYYGAALAASLTELRGVVRYEATELATRTAIRAETVKHRLQGSQSHLYATKAEALAAVRRMEEAEPAQPAKPEAADQPSHKTPGPAS